MLFKQFFAVIVSHYFLLTKMTKNHVVERFSSYIVFLTISFLSQHILTMLLFWLVHIYYTKPISICKVNFASNASFTHNFLHFLLKFFSQNQQHCQQKLTHFTDKIIRSESCSYAITFLSFMEFYVNDNENIKITSYQ